MKVINKSDNLYVMRFDFGEEIIEGIINFAKDKVIKSASFTGIGACSNVLLSYYDLEHKKYIDKSLNEDLEIVSLTGNIGILDNKQAAHAHGVFSDLNFKTFGGHVKSLTVSATCEIHLNKLKGEMIRSHDLRTGLNLLK